MSIKLKPTEFPRMVVDGATSELGSLVQTEIQSTFSFLLHDSSIVGCITMSEKLTEFLAALNQKLLFFKDWWSKSKL